jgi:hypothetical protein
MKLLRKIKYKLKYYISSEPRPEKWVFIAGCSNSGTSLLSAILSMHPLIGSLPDEGQFCTNQLPLNRNIGQKRLWAIPPEKMYMDENSETTIDLTKLKKQWAVRFNNVKSTILLEKSPPNTVRLRWLQANFKNAFFIGIHRNGYAVAEGIKRKVGHPVELGAKQWANANQILLTDFDHLHNKLLISYERLTEQPEETIQDICSFLEITPPLDSEKINSTFKIHGQINKIKNMNDISIKNLSMNELRIIEAEAGNMLERMNYLNT